MVDRFALALGVLLCLSTAPDAANAAADDEQARYSEDLRGAATQLREGRTEDAIATLRTLAARYPSRPEAFNNLAVVYARQGRLERARDLLTRSMNTHPSYATTYQNLSEVLAQLAARAYDAALDNKPASRAPPTLALIESSAPKAPLVLAAGAPDSATEAAPDPELAAPPPASEPAAAVAAAAAPVSGQPPAPPAAAPAPAVTQPAEAALPAPAPAPAITQAAAPAVQAPATQAPAPEPQRPGPDPRLAEVLAAVNGWARAWSDRNVDRYLAYYDSKFSPPKRLTRPQWETQRRERLTNPTRIRVEVRGPSVTFESTDRVSVHFRQHYRSNLLSSTVSKTLRLVKRNGLWKILEERV